MTDEFETGEGDTNETWLRTVFRTYAKGHPGGEEGRAAVPGRSTHRQ